MTKEPKLDRARRQVPEWTAYDEEIAALARRNLKKEGEEGETARQVGKGEEAVEVPKGRKEPTIKQEL